MEEARLSPSLSFACKQVVNGDSEGSNTNQGITDVCWVACKDFTVEVGKDQIAEYIRTWEVHPSWLFSLEFLRTEDEGYRTLHHYRSRWSIPTPRTPIPKATACVYFVIDVSKIRDQTLPVQVNFQVEANRSVHAAGKSRFREKWLKDVVESKTLLRAAIDF
ncbi:A-kinase anchor protein 14 [Lampris incognitus]|uniref:A-kinase anchor protein 14 n=1 Tax=Lampris incognitus TaxID=2546036 RepID=UPI0024B56E41|nr:A-kinase anchor protein 14 [Lampris incognitus]